MKNRNLNHKDDWATPPEFLEKIRKKYGDFFDPCPWHHDLNQWDGLKIEWKKLNYVNPGYSLEVKSAFVKTAVGWSVFGCKSILLLPVSTSTVLFHDWIKPFLKEDIWFLRGRLRFIGINSKGQYVNYDQIQEVTTDTIEYNGVEIPKYVKNSGQHDSMICII
jgi:hypothetical protein